MITSQDVMNKKGLGLKISERHARNGYSSQTSLNHPSLMIFITKTKNLSVKNSQWVYKTALIFLL